MSTRTNDTSHATAKHPLMALGLLASAAATAFSLAMAAANAADAGGATPTAKTPQVTLEAIAGSTIKRITLTAKAADRLGIATDTVSEQTVVRRQMVGGLVIPPMDTQVVPQSGSVKGGPADAASRAPVAKLPPVATGSTAKLPSVGFGGFATAPSHPAAPSPSALKAIATPVAATAPLTKPTATGDVWVLVALSPAEWERTAKDRPARLVALGASSSQQGDLMAQPSGLPPTEDPKRSMLSVYYVVPGKEHGLVVNNRLRVELPLVGPEEKQKVVPYSAVYYDGKGTPWVYVNPKPLVYERQRVTIDRVAGNLAVLSEGPEIGTTVVSVGASLLFGTEIFGK